MAGVSRATCFSWRLAVLMTAPALFLILNLCFLATFENYHFNSMVRMVYAVNTLAMPALFLVASLAGLLHGKGGQRPVGERRLAFAWLFVATLLVSLRIYATHVEPRMLRVHHVAYTTDKIDQPFTMLHLSDIQSDAIGGYEAGVFRRIRELNPDLIVHTGDLLQPVTPATYASELPKLAGLFETLDPPLGMYMVQGDTTGPLLKAKPDETGGIRYLQNEEANLKAPGINIRLYGLTLRSSTSRTWARAGIRQWLAKSPHSLNIVMGHRPDFVLKLNDLPIDICLAGHTHGGQIRLPFYGPLVTFSNVPRSWARGLTEVGNTRLHVSAGIGAEHAYGLPSIRLNCPPEMTLFHFIPAG